MQIGFEVNTFGDFPRRAFMIAYNDTGAAIWFRNHSFHWVARRGEPIRTVRETLNPKRRRWGWVYHIDHRKVTV